jgi:hypothetical protein
MPELSLNWWFSCLASIRNPALIQPLWPNCCLERKTIEQIFDSVKRRLDDTRTQLDQETVAKHYKKASRRVKAAVRNAVVRSEDLKAQASVSLINSISKLDRNGTVAKYYETTRNSALSADRLVRKRFDNQKYRVFLSLKAVLLQLDTNVKSKVGLVTLEMYVHKSICDKESLEARSRRYAVIRSCFSGVTGSETGIPLLCFGILAAVGTGASIFLRGHRR